MAGFTGKERDRYARQLAIPGFGEEGMAKLKAASVLIAGAGGLGSPAALYLAGAGAGRIGIADGDSVALSNLHRQILYDSDSIGHQKAEAARERLLALNPEIIVETHPEDLTEANAESLIGAYDLIIDAVDNLRTRDIINTICIELKKPMVHGAVSALGGRITVFDPRITDSPCYRCLHPVLPEEIGAGEGILGPVPGVIGALQAAEAVKLITGLGEALVGEMLVYDLPSAGFTRLRLRRDPGCPACG